MGAGDPATKEGHRLDRGFKFICSAEGHDQREAGSAQACRQPEISGDRLPQSLPIFTARNWPEKLKA